MQAKMTPIYVLPTLLASAYFRFRLFDAISGAFRFSKVIFVGSAKVVQTISQQLMRADFKQELGFMHKIKREVSHLNMYVLLCVEIVWKSHSRTISIKFFM